MIVKLIRSERGSLPYVILIVLMLAVFVPGILLMTTSTELANKKDGAQKQTTELAVSGLQAFVKYPGTSADKLTYLKTGRYGWMSVANPGGTAVDYAQYAVDAGTPDTDVLDPAKIVAANSIDPNGSYKVVVAAISGDTNHNRIRDSGETLFYKKVLTAFVAPSTAGTITSVTPTPASSVAGTPQSVSVAVTASGVADDTAVTVELQASDGSSLSPPVAGSGTFKNLAANVALTIPAAVPAGTYRLQASAPGAVPASVTYTITPPFNGTISSVTPTPNMNQAGSVQFVAVKIVTTGYPDNTAVTVELVTNASASLSPLVSKSGTIFSNAANVLLQVPATVPVGDYKLKVTALSVTNAATTYSVVQTVPSNVALAITYDANGVQQSFTKTDLQNTGAISTQGVLFIPTSYGQINTVNHLAVDYNAQQGIYIGADIQTKANGDNIHLKACQGPIVIDGAGFDTGTGNADITMEAGTYISAKGTNLNAGRSLSMTANQTIDLSNPSNNPNAIVSGKSITLTARTLADIITTGTNFSRTPTKIGNANNPVQCP
ncbi:hypothetical protein SD70_00695 [Gordoniibacillus kamchatkensis]|uniref:Uncharacterized protein n=1 Tax=Gordoniibacillus kamchatkensis TaxID=1590651 RepID=A0ABR5APJ7_9BACL|nr:hypothetical protein [Paenibacillus sp. VKM B-2647]KIL42460.1 hypothetical protein SD70_00695 [Paenibacillus sp. VKM B-2647]